MSRPLLLQGGRVIDPSRDLGEAADVLVQDGKIASVGRGLGVPDGAIVKILAAGGYPGDYAKGAAIKGLDAACALEGKVFHAGTALKDGQVVTAGGRVLCATAMGASVGTAQQQAYKLAATIDWEGCFYRKDIGYRAIARERGENQE